MLLVVGGGACSTFLEFDVNLKSESTFENIDLAFFVKLEIGTVFEPTFLKVDVDLKSESTFKNIDLTFIVKLKIRTVFEPTF